jgi:hypothetical protein
MLRAKKDPGTGFRAGSDQRIKKSKPSTSTTSTLHQLTANPKAKVSKVMRGKKVGE